jgi:hypothetical protein
MNTAFGAIRASQETEKERPALPLTFLQMHNFIASHSTTPNTNSKKQRKSSFISVLKHYATKDNYYYLLLIHVVPLEHRASVKGFVSLQFLNLIDSR